MEKDRIQYKNNKHPLIEFIQINCVHCSKDKFMSHDSKTPVCSDDELCPILTEAFLCESHLKPKQWVYQENTPPHCIDFFQG